MYDEHGEPSETLIQAWNEHNDHADDNEGDDEIDGRDTSDEPEPPDAPSFWDAGEANAWRAGWLTGWRVHRDTPAVQPEPEPEVYEFELLGPDLARAQSVTAERYQYQLFSGRYHFLIGDRIVFECPGSAITSIRNITLNRRAIARLRHQNATELL
jgi:hypothetical protein